MKQIEISCDSFGLNSNPFLLGATIEYHLSQSLRKYETENVNYSGETGSMLQKTFYVDNCVAGVPNAVVVKRSIQESSVRMEQGCFDLRVWKFTDSFKEVEESSILNFFSD